MTQPIAILIDDEQDIRELLAISLKRMGIDSVQAGSFGEGISLINATSCDLCITDVRMPDGSGLALVKQFKTLHPHTPIVVMTAFDTTDIAVQAMKAGAFDFMAKPIRAKRLESLIEDIRLIPIKRSAVMGGKSGFEAFVGISESTETLRRSAALAAQSMAPVLIQGEHGTGKELLARTIHNQSSRKSGAFVSVDCGAIPPEMLESEFFGHEQDSFPGAQRQKSGLFQAARGGSLLLNELTAIPEHFQVKLRRALTERSFSPLGSDRVEPLDARIFAACTRDLSDQVQLGKMREDLYYYLAVIELQIPPLRERVVDVAPLASHFLVRYSSDRKTEITQDAMETLTGYAYPGNVRELENIIQRSLAMCSKPEITKTDLQFFSLAKGTDEYGSAVVDPLSITDLDAHLDEIESKIISAVLEAEKWNRTKAAKRLNLTPRQFRYKVSKHRLRDP